MNLLVLKLEKKFNDTLLEEIFEHLAGLSEVRLRNIARADPVEGCKNEVQKFIAFTLACTAEAVLKSKFGVDLQQEQSIQE